MTRPLRILVVGALCGVLVVLGIAVVQPEALDWWLPRQIPDFGAYWSGAMLHLQNSNPYDRANLEPLQAAIDPDWPSPIVPLGPPWALVPLYPFAALSFAHARWLWLVVQLTMVLGAISVVWQVYQGVADRLIFVWVAALVFFPTIQMLLLGQLSSLVLVGVLGLLAVHRPLCSGAILALVLVKPQNLFLVGLLVIIWILDTRAWRFAIGGLLGTAILTVVALFPNPEVFSEYRAAMLHDPPGILLSPTPGTLLRFAFGLHHDWLAFVPAGCAVIWGGITSDIVRDGTGRRTCRSSCSCRVWRVRMVGCTIRFCSCSRSRRFSLSPLVNLRIPVSPRSALLRG